MTKSAVRNCFATLAMCAASYFPQAGAQSSAASANVSDGIVKLGVLTDLSGPFSDFAGPGSLAAVRMAVSDFGGTVLGRPIEVVYADHQNKADIGSNMSRSTLFDGHLINMIDGRVA